MAKLKNPVRNVEDEEVIVRATKAKALAAHVDKATIACNDVKKSLIKSLTDGVITSLIEENVVLGTFQIPLADGSIVEVPLSVATDGLTGDELVDLVPLSTTVHDELFEEKKVFEAITDRDKILQYLFDMDEADQAKAFKVKAGEILISVTDLKVDGASLGKLTVPRSPFFARMEQALAASKNVDSDAKLLADFIENRIKGAVKFGNRASKETK